MARVRLLLAIALALGACDKKKPDAPPPTTPEAPKPAGLELATLKAHLEFLAADAQQGRPPGTEADKRVQDYIAGALKQAGLEPGFGGAYAQDFEVTNGVRVRKGGQTTVDVSGLQVPHHLVPYTGDTSQSGPAVAKFVFVGWGLDYSRLGNKVKGRVAVALYGGPDPHADPSKVRPAAKVIAARDRGAVGVIIWDPTSDIVPHNSGDWNDMQIPVLYVSSQGSSNLVQAFGGKAPEGAVDPRKPGIKPGRVTRKKGTLQVDVEPVRLSTANVAGVLRGNGSTDKVVVIGAHMDHLGLGTSSSLAPGEREVHNGADDNASGVAVMLELCRALGKEPEEKRPYDAFCVAFGAEEMGLLGSKFLVENLDKVAKERIISMVNFDMVGRMREQTVTVAGAGTSSVWSELIAAHKGSLSVVENEDGYGPSDHGSFYEVGIPVLHFFTGPHEDYHKPSDDLDKINFEGALEIGTMAFSIVRALGEKKIEPDYVKTKRKSKVGARSFRVRWGRCRTTRAA